MSEPNRMITECPVCHHTALHYQFSIKRSRVVQCEGCRLLLINPQPSDEALAKIYDSNYFLLAESPGGKGHVSELKKATARTYLRLLEKYRSPEGKRLVEIGCGEGDFLKEAALQGLDVTGVEFSPHACETAGRNLGDPNRVLCGTIERLKGSAASYDLVVLLDVLEHVRNPARFLEQARSLLKPEGVLFLVTPNLDSWSARILREKWMEFKEEHLFYFNPATLQTLLFQAGFHEAVFLPGTKTVSVDYLADHFIKYPVPFLTKGLTRLSTFLPRTLRRRPVTLKASGVIMMARCSEIRQRRKLSIIVPVYNEVATVSLLVDALVKKRIAGVDTEIILVESNSTDGSREKVRQYQDLPGIRIIYEDRPRGKGSAVRTGFRHATGDFILIQDADLEYDLEDYDVLLEPLLLGREAFVLGARHGGRSFKMRHFTDQPMQGFLLNMGHWFFTFLVNLMFRLKLKDPFTMYKVFRRDCLFGLTFECNRFDFDFELLIKLVRKGYRPLEIPVNYRSRSFQQGKKVSVLRDPWTWLRALIKFRFCKMNLMEEAEREKRREDGAVT